MTIKTQRIMEELLDIKLKTLPNGYSLEIGKEKYMYMKKEELLDGFIYHVGLEEYDYVDAETRKDIIAAAVTWKDNADAVRELIRYRKMCERLESILKNNKVEIKRLTEKLRVLDGIKTRKNGDD